MKILALGIIAVLSATPAPAFAQDYLGTHLDTIRDDAMRQNQIDNQRAHTRKRGGTAAQRPSKAERQAAWSRNKTEYRRRMLRDGPASADRWLDQQVATNASPRTAAPAPRSNGKRCKKVRYVSRATPGFGGAPMTMSRVAVCDD